jgi:HD-GYP domain-containing protein (c-di-GMP phosphodiesterase class II)
MAHAAYLHDIGMLRVPGAIVEQAGRLAPMEVTEVRRHPIYGLDMLQRLVGRRSGLALSVPMVVYQSHERENGSGYPKGRRGRVIHDFAKIVAACDVYQALTSRRPWRPAMLPYTGMEQLVLMGARREMDPEVVRAVLACVQLFPIGSWVELADGSRGRVVAASGSNYARPVVSLTERRGAPLAAPQRVNLAEHRDLEVVRPIPAPGDAIEPMEGF